MNVRKGTIKIVPKADMPKDANGVVADIAMLSRGIIARTNLGKLYEQYISASSRQTKLEIIDILGVKNGDAVYGLPNTAIDVAYNYLLDYMSLHNTSQYEAYAGLMVDDRLEGGKLTITTDDKKEILKEIVDKELYIIYNIEEQESVNDIVHRLEDSKYKLKIVDVFVKDPLTNTFKAMKGRTFIAPMHIVMLNKITDTFLGSSTFFLNGYGLATGNSKNDGRFPYKFKSVKAWGESEFRLCAAYGSPRLMQILIDRSRSIVNHSQMYRNQLRHGVTTTESLIPDRVEDTDVSINILKAILGPAGLDLEITGGSYDY